MAEPRRNLSLIQLALQWSVCALLLAMGWKYIYWDGPWRSLLWSEATMSPIIRWLGWEWTDWVSSPKVESMIQLWTRLIGAWWILSAIALVLKPAFWAKQHRYWYAIAISLLIHILLSWKGHFWQWGYFIEHSLFMASPLFFTYLYGRQSWVNWHLVAIRIAIAGTFIGHGLYALGFYPVPYHFTGMMMTGFGLAEESALVLLRWIGVIDIIAALFLFLPASNILHRWFLRYIIIWGFLTATARIWSNLPWYDTIELLTVWLPEFLQRLCHFLIPCVLLLYERSRQKTSK